eukprot:CAMPEP_0114628708 /NCGR_PEP_ID=MMETSP0168-20121206/12969_1 /TAXON_ID=95228 ORGANISM="Vannella sp., Strain DIVA3 517/6/12" /NCGR_SAMPLE_ID=MMETSP0168 /ASSEMBLY_ACC=CAM_ASM_000044 /LENGTH=47 /DNA_ID= /DNA_START= /DNA_END= /DNA_ORIENTATION=
MRAAVVCAGAVVWRAVVQTLAARLLDGLRAALTSRQAEKIEKVLGAA